MNQTSSRTFKAMLLGALLSLSTLALALPSPKDIEADVKAGQLDRAETQLRQVLAEKPSSAKAHYELGQVLAREGRYIEAEQELRRAQALEPSLKFASSPQQFDELLAKVGQRNAAPLPAATTALPASGAAGTHSPVHVAAPATRAEPSLPWGRIALVIGVIALLVVWLRRAAAANALARTAPPVVYPADTQGFGHGYTPAPSYPGYGGYPPATATGGGMGSAVTGAVVGGLAGVAAGYALSKALEGEHHAAPESRPGTDFIPVDTPRATPDFGAFDAGAGDGWDSASGDSGGDSDSW
ncbi:MAG: hypothetical protein RJA36_1244 [Pseudomonadota bacterium]